MLNIAPLSVLLLMSMLTHLYCCCRGRVWSMSGWVIWNGAIFHFKPLMMYLLSSVEPWDDFCFVFYVNCINTPHLWHFKIKQFRQSFTCLFQKLQVFRALHVPPASLQQVSEAQLLFCEHSRLPSITAALGVIRTVIHVNNSHFYELFLTPFSLNCMFLWLPFFKIIAFKWIIAHTAGCKVLVETIKNLLGRAHIHRLLETSLCQGMKSCCKTQNTLHIWYLRVKLLL